MTEEKKTIVKKTTKTEKPETATEVKTVVKPVKTTKAKTKTDDLILASASEIETISKEKAFGLVDELINSNDFNLFKVGGLLAVIQENGWYLDENFESLKDFVETKYDMQYRRALYWINIYKNLVAANVPWSKVSHIGWTKLRLISDLITEENIDEYIELCNDMTQLQLAEYLKGQKKGSVEAPSGSKDSVKEAVSDAKKLSGLTFKVHADQKEVINEALEQAKNEVDTEFDSVALETICLGYLSGGQSAPKKPEKEKPVKGFKNLHDAMAASSFEEVLDIFAELWPDIGLKVTIPGEEEEEEEEIEEEEEEEAL